MVSFSSLFGRDNKRPEFKVTGNLITEAKSRNSSPVSDYNYSYLNVVRPKTSFSFNYELYSTIGRVQNTIESYVTELLSRDWYYEGAAAGVRACEEFEDKFNLSRLIEYVVRDLLVTGNCIIGTTDWQPVQITSITGMKRNDYGVTEDYYITVDGREVPLVKTMGLNIDSYIHVKYIELNREAWGVGLFHSLTTTFNYNNKSSVSELDIYRRHIQNLAKIEEKFASPRIAWIFEGVAQEVIDNTITPLLKAMLPGDRLAFNRKPEIVTETVDMRSQIISAIGPILDAEIDAGLQSSANRLITQPSAMADAGEANKKDDARLLGIMEKVRRLINEEIIPRITDSKVEFKWGSQDSFEIEMPQGLDRALSLGIVSKLEARQILISMGWKLDDSLYNQEQEQKQAMFTAQQQLVNKQKDKEQEDKQKRIEAVDKFLDLASKEFVNVDKS